MKKLITAIVATIILASNAQAQVKFHSSVDEMTDSKRYSVLFLSENYGKYRHKGKALMLYRCSNGKADFYAKTPGDFVGSHIPKGVDYRADKNDQVKIYANDLSPSADGKAVFIEDEAKTDMIKAIKAGNTLKLRVYDFRGSSEALFTFNLKGSTAAINKANKLGGCK